MELKISCEMMAKCEEGWPEGEVGSFDDEMRRKAHSMTIEELDADWIDFLKNVTIEDS